MCVGIKAIKAALKGSKVQKISIVEGKVCASDSEHSLWFQLDESVEGELSYDSITELELDGMSDTVASNEYPLRGKAIDAKDWAAINWCAGATDQEATRYALGAVSLEGNHAIGTDGRRLHISKLAVSFDESIKLLVAKRTVLAVTALLKLFKDDAVWVDETVDKHIVFTTKHWRMLAVTVEGRFPMWRNVDPRTNKDALLEPVILFSSLLAAAKDEIAKHKLMIKAGKADKDSTAVVKVKGDGQEIKLDANFVVDAMWVLRGSKSLRAYVPRTPAFPVVFDGGTEAAIVMPMA